MPADPLFSPSAARRPDYRRESGDWLDAAGLGGSDLWVFGYGSLMWNPGFQYLERHIGRLPGYHRRFCVWSLRYRGTPEHPGLVLGLDRGGSCLGMLFRIAAAAVPDTLEYLWEREMNSYAYRPKLLRVRLRGAVTADGRSEIEACSFVVDREHVQYCNCLDEEGLVRRIAECQGQRGSNLDYLANTVEHLRELGIGDRRMFSLYAAVLSARAEVSQA